MPVQPRNQDELVRSMYDVNTGVIPTVATHATNALSQEHRNVATAMQAHAMAVGNGIGNQRIGATVTINHQTDFALRDGVNPHFAMLWSYATELGRRLR